MSIRSSKHVFSTYAGCPMMASSARSDKIPVKNSWASSWWPFSYLPKIFIISVDSREKRVKRPNREVWMRHKKPLLTWKEKKNTLRFIRALLSHALQGSENSTTSAFQETAAWLTVIFVINKIQKWWNVKQCLKLEIAYNGSLRKIKQPTPKHSHKSPAK